MKKLVLNLKGRWFKMIESGEKREEYREIKFHWLVRFISFKEEMESQHIEEMICDLKTLSNKPRHKDQEELLKYFQAEFKKFDLVEFRLGYSRHTSVCCFEFNGFEIGRPNPEWCGQEMADSKDCFFILKIGKRMGR